MGTLMQASSKGGFPRTCKKGGEEAGQEKKPNSLSQGALCSTRQGVRS
jgi:hypothetical protein